MKLFTHILHFIAIFFTELDEILSTRYIAITILFVVAGMKTAGLSMIVGLALSSPAGRRMLKW